MGILDSDVRTERRNPRRSTKRDPTKDPEKSKKSGFSVIVAASLAVGGTVGYALFYVCPWLPIPYYGGYIAATGLSCWYTYQSLSSCCEKKPENQQNNGDKVYGEEASKAAAAGKGEGFLAKLNHYKVYVGCAVAALGLL